MDDMYYKLIRTYKDEGTKAVHGMLYRTSHYFNNRSNEGIPLADFLQTDLRVLFR